MSAPSSAYNGIKISDITTSTEVLHSEGNSFGDSVETIKSRFYLDDIFPSQTGFIGCCYAGSFNALHHSESRYGSYVKFRETVSGNGDWRHYKWFVDAGLNTKADAEINQVRTTAVNHLKVVTTFKSAYYDGSTEHGYYLWGGSDATWRKIVINQDYQPQNTSISPTEIAYSAYENPQTIYIKPYIINPEGEYVGAEIGISGTEAIYHYGALYRTSVCDHTNQTNTEMWMKGNEFGMLDTSAIPQDNASATGIRAYQNDEMTIPIPSGFYAGIAGVEKVFVVDGSGQFTNWLYCQPPATPKDVLIYVFQEFLDENNYYYGISCILNGVKNYDINISGYIASFNGSDQQIGGSVGNADFNITIPAGQNSAQYNTTYQPAFGAAYSKAIVGFITAGTTYETFAG